MWNHNLTFAIFFETALAAVLSYAPGTDAALNMQPLLFRHWLPALPFSFAIFCYDEFRKRMVRKSETGFFYVETYY